jgi:hypothetical protein
MRPAKAVLGIRGGGIKKNDGKGEFKYNTL